MSFEAKWKANSDKVEFMKQFPGLVLQWESAVGKTIHAVIPLREKAGRVVVLFEDGSFIITPAVAPDPAELKEALNEARPQLEPFHHDAYLEYDRLTAKDHEAQRAARLDNILGAIHNNLPHIPELKERLKALVKEWQ